MNGRTKMLALESWGTGETYISKMHGNTQEVSLQLADSHIPQRRQNNLATSGKRAGVFKQEVDELVGVFKAFCNKQKCRETY